MKGKYRKTETHNIHFRYAHSINLSLSGHIRQEQQQMQELSLTEQQQRAVSFLFIVCPVISFIFRSYGRRDLSGNLFSFLCIRAEMKTDRPVLFSCGAAEHLFVFFFPAGIYNELPV